MTDDQSALLRDKYVLWERASREGPMDLRDYNRRAAEALKAALMIVSEYLRAAPAEPESSLEPGDVAWLRGLLDPGHFGEGTLKREMRERNNAHIERILAALPAPAEARSAKPEERA